MQETKANGVGGCMHAWRHQRGVCKHVWLRHHSWLVRSFAACTLVRPRGVFSLRAENGRTEWLERLGMNYIAANVAVTAC
jgi:hypothetical protein